ncbi:MAG: restriction endonuclease subunit S [Caldisericum sp.]|uniref:restriction endonuclease subunit S n=1 Tax=Caldisericum sp. TaxID=2499687 RepID=UPI003D0BC32A
MECFKVYANEIEGRLDPFYYKPEFYELEKKLENLKWKIVKLSDIFEISRGGSPRPINKFFTTEENGVNWIKIGDTKGVDKYIYKTNQKIKPEGVKFSRVVKEGDFILSNSMSFGRPYIMKTTGCIHDGWLLLREKDRNLNKEFLYYLLSTNLIYKFFKRVTLGGVVDNLNIDLVKEVKVPLLPLETQEKIVALMDKVYSIKKSHEVEAQKLLDSISDYILDELGIKLPELKDKMSYVVDSSSIRGRVDPYYYQPKFEEVEKSIYQGKFEVKELKDSFKNDLIKGMLPSEEEKDGDIKVLQIKNILKNGLINTSEYVTAKNIFKSEHKIKKEEIIIVITGATIGKVGLWYSDEEFYLGGDMIKFSVNNRFNPYFIQAFLLSQAGQYQLMREITGATNKHLSPDNIKAIKVSLPPLEIQNKIAEEVKTRMQKAKKLQEEAKTILEEAKERVERIILGNEEI